MEEPESHSSIEIGLLDDTADIVTAAVDRPTGDQLDEAKVKLKVEELQREMIQLAKSQVA